MAGRGDSADARGAIMASIREHLAASAPFDAVHEEQRARHDGEARAARPPAIAREAALAPLERFKQSLEAVGGRCEVVRGEAEAAGVLARIVGGADARRVAVSDSPLVRGVVARVNADAQFAENIAAAEMFDCDLGVTGAQWAVAETGTLVLESDAERHRLASLVPPVHVALVEAGSVRGTMAEVLQAIGEQGRERMSRTITFVTGPSRTSDIELTLAIGVHGPAELYVVVIGGEGNG